MPPGWSASWPPTGAYSSHLFGSGVDEYKVVLQGPLAAAATGIACYLTKCPLPRGFFLLLFVLDAVGLVT